jgi:hypothetical protein
LKARHVDVTIVHETLPSMPEVAISSIGTTLLNSLHSVIPLSVGERNKNEVTTPARNRSCCHAALLE